MRRVTSLQVQKGAATAIPLFIPAPIGGLNTRDPPALVPITEMIDSTYMFPSTAGLVVRRAHTEHATSTPAACQTLMVYTNSGGTETMFGAMGTGFYNVTSAGAVGAAVVSGLTNAVWQHVNFTNSSATSYLCCFNGVDSPRFWDGSSWITITGVSTPAITGLTTSTIISGAVCQRRLWLVQVDSLKAWYLPIDSVGGAAQAIDLGGIADLGGYIMALSSWTVDGGIGVDDYLVCITSLGQIVIFAGTDPSSASTWTLVGVWNVAPPVGRRCMYQYKGDLLILTASGVVSCTKVFRGDSSESGMLSAKISRTYTNLYSDQKASNPDALNLWQLLHYPDQSMLLLSTSNFGNVYAMNTVTAAWSGVLETQVYCWGILNGNPYFGSFAGNKSIDRFWSSSSSLDDGTTTIAAGFSSGASDFGYPGIIKRPSLARPVMDSSASSLTSIQLTPDYIDPIGTTGTRIEAVQGIAPWFSTTSTGVAFSIRYVVESANPVTYNGLYVVANPGGIVGAANG